LFGIHIPPRDLLEEDDHVRGEDEWLVNFSAILIWKRGRCAIMRCGHP
jgi:hypothetical protein